MLDGVECRISRRITGDDHGIQIQVTEESGVVELVDAMVRMKVRSTICQQK